MAKLLNIPYRENITLVPYTVGTTYEKPLKGLNEKTPETPDGTLIAVCRNVAFALNQYATLTFKKVSTAPPKESYILESIVDHHNNDVHLQTLDVAIVDYPSTSTRQSRSSTTHTDHKPDVN